MKFLRYVKMMQTTGCVTKILVKSYRDSHWITKSIKIEVNG